jgi:hypothetical protein
MKINKYDLKAVSFPDERIEVIYSEGCHGFEIIKSTGSWDNPTEDRIMLPWWILNELIKIREESINE